MPSTTLTHDTTNNLSGVNLKWVHTDLASIREITLVYFKNTPNSQINSLDVAPSYLKSNLKTGFDSGASYQFQLQVTDINAVTVYSNSVTVTTPYFLVSPSISTITGLDASIKVQLGATANILTNAGGDEVEFVLNRQSDNALFWIVMPYVAGGLYTLSHGSLVNQDNYTVACMYQPDVSNANYSAPSAMSNSMTGTPSNIPNVVGSVVGLSVGTVNYDCKFTWTKPSDFAEWDDNFYVHLLLTDSANATVALNLAQGLDVLEHTFTGLTAGLTYKCAVDYHNAFGEGAPIESSFTSLTKISSAPVLDVLTENDTAIHLEWHNVEAGQTAIISYKIYDGADALIATVTTANATATYDVTGLTNGDAKNYKVTTVNAIGESGVSNIMAGIPYGPMTIVSAVPTGKTLTLTINPNGRPVERIIMLGLDADPTEELVANSIFDIPQGQISQTANANIVVAKTFTGLSGNLTFHLAVVHCNAVVQFIKSV